jgi:hypothetical protein
MGLLTSKKKEDLTINDLKYKSVSSLERSRILNKIKEEWKRKKFARHFDETIGRKTMSVDKLAKSIGDKFGYKARRKFLEAVAAKYLPPQKGLTEEQKRRNIISSIYSREETDKYIKERGGLGISNQGEKEIGLANASKGSIGVKIDRPDYRRRKGENLLRNIKGESTEKRLNTLGYLERSKAHKTFASDLIKKGSNAKNFSPGLKPPANRGINMPPLPKI